MVGVKGKKRYFKGDICKYFYEGEQPEGWVLGTPHSTREKISNSVKVLWEDDKYRSSQVDIRNTEEYHNKMSNVSKESWELNREQRAESLSKAAFRRFERDEEHIACSERMKLPLDVEAVLRIHVDNIVREYHLVTDMVCNGKSHHHIVVSPFRSLDTPLFVAYNRQKLFQGVLIADGITMLSHDLDKP